MNIKTNKQQTGLLISILTIAVALSACSSKPSPWSQQGSPWAADKQEPVAEEMPAEAPAEESMPAAEAEAVPAWVAEPEATVAAATVEEKAEAEPMMAESQPMETTAMAEPAEMVAGDLMSQTADNYVVQVCASSSMEKLMAFAKANDLPDQWTAQTSVDGKTWYVLMLGIYPTKAEADGALSSIADKNLATQPWVRTVGSVQAVAQ